MNPDPYIKALFGEKAVHTAFNYVVQNAGAGKAAIIGNTSFSKEMSFGGVEHAPHTLVLCDVIIRPRLVIASRHLVGVGAAGILRSEALASPDEWLANGKILIKNI